MAIKKAQEDAFKVALSAPENLAALGGLNKAEKKSRVSRAQKKSKAVRDYLWPDLDESTLWDRNRNDGFSTVPRTLSLMCNIIDDLSKKKTGKSVPAGKTYFGLWCRLWDGGMLVIENEAAYAIEAGYNGERKISTWRAHMKVLVELGFILAKDGVYGPYSNVLVLNPYRIMRKLKSDVTSSDYQFLIQRASEIGADSDVEILMSASADGGE